MGYQQQDGTYVDALDVTLHASKAETATVTGAWIEAGRRGVARLTLDVVAKAGTSPTLDVDIETSDDGTNNVRTVASFTQKTDVGSERKCFAGLDRFVRMKATLGGTTPSFTFSVEGEAV